MRNGKVISQITIFEIIVSQIQVKKTVMRDTAELDNLVVTFDESLPREEREKFIMSRLQSHAIKTVIIPSHAGAFKATPLNIENDCIDTDITAPI